MRIRIRVQPRASRSEVGGVHGDEVRVRVTAPPVGGAANEALTRLLAERLGVPQSAVALTAGASGRSKVVQITGVTPRVAAERLGVAEPESGSSGT